MRNIISLTPASAAGSVAVLVGCVLGAMLAGCGLEDSKALDPSMTRFVAAKRAQAKELAKAETNRVPAEVWQIFDAVEQGRWRAATNHYRRLAETRHSSYRETPARGFFASLWQRVEDITGATQRAESQAAALKGPIWTPIFETLGAAEQFREWDPTLLHRYGHDIMASIPAASIYFGGTDPGRFVIAALGDSEGDGKPFFILNQNALADETYMDFLRATCGRKVHIPSSGDCQGAFREYLKDAEQRLRSGHLKPNENSNTAGDRILVSGQNAVMEINGRIVRQTFDLNPDHEFFVEESCPLDWMYPYLSPHGLIFKLNRAPLPALSDEVVRADHDYWQSYAGQLVGDWLRDDTSVKEVADFAARVHLKKNHAGFRGDQACVRNPAAQKAFSKLRSSIGGLYTWRANHAGNDAEKARMCKEADFAFRQAFALCPTSLEVVFRYSKLLRDQQRLTDALVVVGTAQSLDPANVQIHDLLQQLKAQAGK